MARHHGQCQARKLVESRLEYHMLIPSSCSAMAATHDIDGRSRAGRVDRKNLWAWNLAQRLVGHIFVRVQEHHCPSLILLVPCNNQY